MKNCPNCKSEIEEGYDICWKCNHDLKNNKAAEIIEKYYDPLSPENKHISCLRCNIQLEYSGNFKIHEGEISFPFLINQEALDLYVCPKCNKVEFFVPKFE